MQTIEFSALIEDATAEVLESMCFTSVAGNVTETVLPDAGWISVKLHFSGPSCGDLGISAPLTTARALAANFLGEEQAQVDPSQCTEFVCELSNMICGALLGRCGSDGVYKLSHPTIDSYAPCPLQNATCQTLQLDEGELYIWLTLENPA
jgi:CheY-specific phosphatase CheX